MRAVYALGLELCESLELARVSRADPSFSSVVLYQSSIKGFQVSSWRSTVAHPRAFCELVCRLASTVVILGNTLVVGIQVSVVILGDRFQEVKTNFCPQDNNFHSGTAVTALAKG